MAAKIIGFICLFALINTLNAAQYLNRIVPNPGCGPNILPLPVPVGETLIPNQVVLGPNYGPNCGPLVEVPYGIDTIINNPVLPASTIIQDSTVANNLANALQLLVVSNLLSNTLPLGQEVVVPALSYGAPLDYGVVSPISPVLSPINPVLSPLSKGCGCGCGYGPYNYIY